MPPRFRLIASAMKSMDGPPFIRETALSAGDLELAAVAREAALVLGAGSDIADTMVTTAKRVPSEPRVRMANAVQNLWTGIIDVEDPDLETALNASAATIGAALWPANFGAPEGSPSLYSDIVEVQRSIENLSQDRGNAVLEDIIAVGRDFARSVAWHSDSELAKSGKFRASITTPGLARALSLLPWSSGGIDSAQIAVNELESSTYGEVLSRFIPEKGVRKTAGVELEVFNDTKKVMLQHLTPAEPTDQRITVYFGTDRAKAVGSNHYANRRDPDDAMHYGIATVDVPESHRIGHRRRLRIGWRTISWAGSSRLTHVLQLSHEDFLREIDRELSASSDDEPRVVVFVHGFKTSFRNAMLTVGQFAADLGVPGVTAAFSWPSANRPRLYNVDRREARSSAAHLVDFIMDLTSQSGARSVDIVFHSMGNHLLRSASNSLVSALRAAGQQLGAVILAAPDITSHEFAQLAALRPSLSSYGTMYATKRDLALGASAALHRASRAGTLPPVVTHSDIHTIDATLVNESFLGHGYHSAAREVIADIHGAVHGVHPSSRYGLSTQPSPLHWRIKP